MKYYKKTAIGAKIETNYGVRATITQADLIKCREMTITPIEADEVERGNRARLGTVEKVLVNKRATVTFTVDLAGSGTAGTPPAWGALLRACQFRQTVVANTSVSYKPNGVANDSISILYNIDGNDHRLRGARGSVVLDLNAGEIPSLVFTFTGIPDSIIGRARLDGTYNSWTDGVVLNQVNTPVAELDNTPIAIETLSFDVANDVQFVDRTNQAEVLIRARAMTGSINFSAQDLSTKNYFTKVESDTPVPLTITHGTTAGNTVKLTAPKVQLTNPGYADNSGEVMTTYELNLIPSAGNDEIEIEVK